MSEKIYHPCESCVHEGKCENHHGCYRWKCWFKAYWAELRRIYGKEP